jgi:hypothetical protein
VASGRFRRNCGTTASSPLLRRRILGPKLLLLVAGISLLSVAAGPVAATNPSQATSAVQPDAGANAATVHVAGAALRWNAIAVMNDPHQVPELLAVSSVADELPSVAVDVAPLAAAPAVAPRLSPPAPKTAAPSVATARSTVTHTTTARPSSYGCGPALAYLRSHSAPGFTFECPGYAYGRQAMTCFNHAPECAGEKIIVINDPCPAAYMNEANNSWVLTKMRAGVIDPYGYCH